MVQSTASIVHCRSRVPHVYTRSDPWETKGTEFGDDTVVHTHASSRVRVAGFHSYLCRPSGRKAGSWPR